MIKYASELTDFPRWAAGFSRLLLIPATGGRKGIPSDRGKGYLRTGRLYSGISFIIMEFSLRDELTLTFLPSRTPGLLLQFNLETHHSVLRLFSTDNTRETTYEKNTRIRKIGILATNSFLRYHLLKPILTELYRQANNSADAYSEPISADNRTLLEDVLRADPSTLLHRLYVHNRLLLLAEKFLLSFTNKTPQSHPDSVNWARATEKDLYALQAIMKTLSDSSIRKFPSIELLSRSAMMSSTKLKTRFKQIYGMKLYEFFSHQRLLHAKEMLRTGRYTVRQVGVHIGFSNLSNFAKAFKREFGVLPREILNAK